MEFVCGMIIGIMIVLGIESCIETTDLVTEKHQVDSLKADAVIKGRGQFVVIDSLTGEVEFRWK